MCIRDRSPNISNSLIPGYAIQNQSGTYQEACGVVSFNLKYTHKHRSNWQIPFGSNQRFSSRGGHIYLASTDPADQGITVLPVLPTDASDIVSTPQQQFVLTDAEKEMYGRDISINGAYIYCLGSGEFENKVTRINATTGEPDDSFNLDVGTTHFPLQSGEEWHPRAIATTTDRFYICGYTDTALRDTTPPIPSTIGDLVATTTALPTTPTRQKPNTCLLYTSPSPRDS